jgi:hypothetical protein
MRAVIVAGLGLSLSVVPLISARAASPSAQAQPLAPQADPDAQVRALHETGMARFEAAEYDEALIMWTRAFVLVPHDPDQQTIRATLVTNIVAAHRRAYEVGRNPEHLAEAIRVIDVRKAELALRSQDETVGETQTLDAQRAELEQLQDQALRESERPRELAVGTAFRFEPAPPPVLDRDQLDAAVAADPELGLRYRKGKSMTDGGIVLMAIGGGLAIPAILMAGIWQPKDERSLNDRSHTIPFVAPLASISFACLVAGGTLYGVGNKRKQRAREGYRASASATGMVVPISLPRGGGLGFVGRF